MARGSAQAPAEHRESTTRLAPPQGQAETYALSVTPAQERFWSLDRRHPGDPSLNMPLMWRCSGDLDVPALQQAYSECVQRHESLRTTFAIVDGKLKQLVHERLYVELPVVDLSGLEAEQRRMTCDALTREHAAFHFDVEQGPLIALKLLRLGAKDHLLLVTMHHIICDGISNGILMRDLFALYEAKVAGGEAGLPELPIQFADYALWYEQWVGTEEYEGSIAFWLERLGDGFTPLKMPADPGAADELPDHLAGSTGAIETQLVPGDIVGLERAFCHAQGVTQNVFFFAIFLAWLNRITGETDLMVGYPIANRSEDTQELIGLFINIQPIRVKLTEETTFLELLRFVEKWTIEATDHQALPFESLAQHPAFAESHNALQVPIFFLYQPSFMQILRIHTGERSLQVIPLRSESPGAIFDMMLAVVDRLEEGPRLQLEYSPQEHRRSTVRRNLQALVSVMDAAVADPQRKVLEMPVVGAAEKHALLARSAGPTVDFGGFESVQACILQRAEQWPQRVAMVCAGDEVTYAQLLKRSRAIAARLGVEGVAPGDRIAVCMGRSADTVAALLGILLCGAAYVPLDARYPLERIEMAVADSGAKLLLTERHLAVSGGIKLLDLANVTESAGAFVPHVAQTDDLAYVIYTSGSTGIPKGVAVPHGALRNLLLSVKTTPGMDAEDVIVGITTISFDIAALEIFLPLMTGARLVFATENEARVPSLLLELLTASNATMLQATPGAWRALIDEGWQGAPALKVLCGGEALSRDLATRLLDRSASVWNMYGPTETTIWSSATRVTRGEKSPTVQQVLPNQQFYILDDRLQLVPAGMTGELCIAGAGVAAGYWQRPDLTEARFQPNPFGPGRLYRTGDLACMDDLGGLRVLGRKDFQVKVQGYRIELGEIENALERHAAVREAVVIQHVLQDHSDRAGVARLIAYVDAPHHADDVSAPALILELEQAVARTLPEYMLPNAIVALPELPRLINGKVNRKALPDVFEQAGDAGVAVNPTEATAFQAPRDVIERQLTDVWQSTLGIPRISTQASFFSLAVGSLAAMRLVTKMNRIFAVDFGLATLVSAPTIQDIAVLIQKQHTTSLEKAIVPIRTTGTRPPLFVLAGVGGNIISFIGLSKRLGDDQPVYGIQSQALLRRQAALLRIEDMAAYYIREIKTVQPQGPYHLLGYSFGGTVAAEMSAQLHAAGEQVAYLSMLDARTLSFEDRFRSSMTVQGKLDRRFRQIVGNTSDLGWSARLQYLGTKIATRAVRFTSRLMVALGARRLPSFMKVAWDVNHVAIKTYKPHAYPGRLILFRATDQDYAAGPRDLGWSQYFPGGVDIYEIPGDHERIFLEPAVDDMAKAIRKTLEQERA